MQCEHDELHLLTLVSDFDHPLNPIQLSFLGCQDWHEEGQRP